MRMRNSLSIEVRDDCLHFRESFGSCRVQELLVHPVS